MAKEWSDLSGCKFIVEGPGSRIHIIMGSASDMPVVNKAVAEVKKLHELYRQTFTPALKRFAAVVKAYERIRETLAI